MKKKQYIPIRFLRNPIHCLSLGLGSGLSPWMPGTCGTLLGVIIYIFMPQNLLVYLSIVVAGFIVGIFLCDYTSKKLNAGDHPAIVWDEIIGYLITMCGVPKSWVWIIFGFLLFRLFDISKPWPISWCDKHIKGGFGIMLDDLIAGLFALIIIYIIQIVI